MSGREPVRKTEETGHDYVRERLSAYLDGQLLGKERQAVEEHLAACSSCRWDLHTLRQTVLWTRDLPTVPVPRSFILPVPATAPARAARPRWRLVPAFQLATALVALLLFFAVAGDWALTGMQPASMPAAGLGQQNAGTQVALETTLLVEEVTEEAGLMQAVPAEPAGEAAMEKALEPPAARTLPTEVPLVEEAPRAAMAAPEVTVTPDLPATQTAAPPGMGGGVPDYESPPPEPTPEPFATVPIPGAASDAASETPVAGLVPVTPEVAESEATLELETMAEAAPLVAPQATAQPELLGTPVSPLAEGEEALAGPTAPVQVEEPVEALSESQPSAEDAAEQADDGQALQARATDWLRLIEYGLAALLVLLVGTTAALMVWRRRAG